MAIEMDRLSFSRLDMYRTCPRAFYKRYVEHAEVENETSDFFADFGTLAHSLYEAHADANGLIPKSALLDMYINGSSNRGGDVKGFNDIKWPEYFMGRKSRMQDTYYQHGIEIIDRLLQRNVSNIIGSEVEFNIKIRDDIAPINGFIDRIIRDEHGIKIVDFKSAKPYEQQFCDTSLQLSIYAMACLSIYNELPYMLEYEFFRFDKYMRTTRTIEQLEEAKREIIQLWESIQSGKFDAQYDNFYCNHFCQYHMNCELYKAKQDEKQEAKLAKQQKRGVK